MSFKLEKKDDDLVLDFTRVKNFFKKSDKTDSPAKEGSNDKVSHQDEEISFNFSKVKGFFKGLGKKKEDEKQNDDLSFDAKKALIWIMKYRTLLLLIIPLFLAISIRWVPAYLPITDDWAENAIANSIRQQISNEINAKYPNLPEANKATLINGQLQQFIKANEKSINDQKKEVSQQFKSQLQKGDQSYPTDIDQFFWLRYAENIIERGHPGDELRNPQTREICEKISKNCVPWDNHMYAPMGGEVSKDMFNAYVIAYWHKAWTVFEPGADLLRSAFAVPIIFSALAIIPVFFIARRACGNFGAFVASIIVAVHPAFLIRTFGGSADTDPYNVFLPLIITWLFLESFESKSLKKNIALSFVAGICVAIYSITWGGWWYIFDFLVISLLLFMVIYVFLHRDQLNNILAQRTIRLSAMTLAVFFFTSLIFTTMFTSYSTFENAINGPIGFTKFKEVAVSTIWPNVFTTVAEQNPASLEGVINQAGIGSILLFLLSIVGISISLIKPRSSKAADGLYFTITLVWCWFVLWLKPDSLMFFLFLISLPIIGRIALAVYKKEMDLDFKLAIILMIWFGSTIYASTKGIRYTLLIAPIAGIGIGIALGFIYNFASYYAAKYMNTGKVVTKIIAMAVILAIFIPGPYSKATDLAKQQVPIMNDAWYDSLDKIKQESAQNAIINSWWDYGHWFKAVSDRAVTFDGTSQDTPMAHWIGNALLTNDEDLAVGILRMLDCGSVMAFWKLNSEINDGTRSVDILYKVLVMDKESARKELLGHIGQSTAEEVLKYTHCEPPENYFITSDDMISKSGVWAHFGSWNFDKAFIYNTLKSKEYVNNKQRGVEFLKDRFNYTDKDAENVYREVSFITNSNDANSWIAPWPSYGSRLSGCSTREDNIICPLQTENGGIANVDINLKNRTANIMSSNGIVHPKAVVFPTKDGIDKIEYPDSPVGFTMTLIPSGDSWSYIMMSAPLEDGIFTRLYFLDGHGLTKFRKFSDMTSFTGNRIVIWKIDWNGTNKNLVYFNEEAPSLQENISDVNASNQ